MKSYWVCSLDSWSRPGPRYAVDDDAMGTKEEFLVYSLFLRRIFSLHGRNTSYSMASTATRVTYESWNIQQQKLRSRFSTSACHRRPVSMRLEIPWSPSYYPWRSSFIEDSQNHRLGDRNCFEKKFPIFEKPRKSLLKRPSKGRYIKILGRR